MSNKTNIALMQEIENIAKSKNIEQAIIEQFLIDSIKKAYNKATYEDNLKVEINHATNELITNVVFTVMDEADPEFDECIHIGVNSAEAKTNNLKVGDTFEKHYDLSTNFKQHNVQQMMQFFKQKITEINNQRVYESWIPVKNKVIYAEIEKVDEKSNSYTINLDNQYDKDGNLLEPTLGFLSSKELNPNETLDVRKKYLFVVIDVKEQSKFCPVILSRASEKLVEHFLTTEVPEIDDGEIKIVKAVRIAGQKTKVLVSSKTLPTDPASICVGPRGERIKAISNQLNGEKIEIYTQYDDPMQTLNQIVIKNAVVRIAIDEENKIAVLVVKDEDLSRAIGKKGNNVKLASMLSGYDIDVILEKDMYKYSDLNFVNCSKQYRFNNNYNTKPNYAVSEDLDSQFNIDMEEFEEIIEDLNSNSELKEAYNNEVQQILNNEKNKI